MSEPVDQLQQAEDSGRYARQAGRGRETCPRYGIHAGAVSLRVRWLAGWDREDQVVMAQRRTGRAA